MSFSRRAFNAALLAAFPLAARAQAWPAKPIHVIVPFPPGGTTDYVTRLVTTPIGASLGQTVIVDNKPGAGTVIGVDAAAKSPADGYTLVTVANSFAVNQTLVKNLPYDSAKDLRPVALMGLSEHVLAAHPSLGIRNVTELVAYSKKNPGKLSYASFGNGTSAHLAGEMLRLQLGLDIVHVPYKGQGPALSDLLGGQVSMMFGNWPEFREHVESGKLVAIGMATSKRSVFAPKIPTLTEQGAPVESNSWNGLLAPSKVPDAVVARLNAEVNKSLASASVVEAFRKGGIVSLAGSPEQFAGFLGAEAARYAKVIRDANIRAD
ncbi:MAG: tripartite tricarboxylate transporter substrate binding protein [Burkholderiales bacterium]